MFIKETCKELIKLEIEELQEDLTSEEFKGKINKEIEIYVTLLFVIVTKYNY